MNRDRILRSNRLFVAAWAAFHIVIIGLFVISLCAGRELSIDADLFHMLPSSTLSDAMGEADARLSDSTARNVFVLASHEDFAAAKKAAETAYGALEGNRYFTSLSFYTGESTLDELEDFLHPYRWALLDPGTADGILSEGGAGRFAEDAIAEAYSPFTLSSLSYIEEDPFMLDERSLRSYMAAVQDAATAMTAKDGVLASEYEGKWYVLIRGTLSKEGAAIASSSNGISAIYDACTPLETDGVRFVYYGTAFHSHQSSNSAVSEIGLISTVTLSVVVILLFIVFRNPVPIVASVLSILLSMLTAFSATHLIYGRIHILTLVLGTSLIGSCIDYSLHFFINWKANRTLDSGSAVRRHLFRGLFLSLLSTLICYALLVFAPFDLLKQMGAFSFTGILSSFLTVSGLYALLPLQPEKDRHIPLLHNFGTFPLRKFTRAHRGASLLVTGAVAVAFLCIVAAKHQNLRIHNDMYKLYTMQGRLKEDNDLAAAVTQYDPKGWFIVRGSTEQELLEHEEYICARLDEVQHKGYLATSRFIPSVSRQKKSLRATRELLPLAGGQVELLLGTDSDETEQIVSGIFADVAAAEDRLLLPSQPLPESIASVPGMLWLGQIEGDWYSIVMPVQLTDEAVYARIAEESGFAYYENKMQDLGKGLDRLTRQILVLFAVAYIVILCVLKWFYSWRQVAKIASIPLVSVMLILSVFLLVGQDIEFFGLTGVILVFGLGLDYIIYVIENTKREKVSPGDDAHKLEPFAILLSFVTTALSFGALALSTFIPVHILGLTIFLGLVGAFFCTLY